MIRYYTYYNCGGYKDIYIGADTDSEDAHYFIPLLPVWLKNNKPGDKVKIERAQSVAHVGLISQTDRYGFPKECIRFFSHGGYKALFRMLSTGEMCLGIREIVAKNTSLGDQSYPFNMLLIADTPESIQKLGAFAYQYLKDANNIEDSFCKVISYDPVVNGIKFDTHSLNEIVNNSSPLDFECSPEPLDVTYLKLASRKDFKLSLQEQNIKAENIKEIYDSTGLIYDSKSRDVSTTTTKSSDKYVNQTDEETNHKDVHSVDEGNESTSEPISNLNVNSAYDDCSPEQESSDLKPNRENQMSSKRQKAKQRKRDQLLQLLLRLFDGET